MKFIVDAQLPKTLADFLNWKGMIVSIRSNYLIKTDPGITKLIKLQLTKTGLS